MRKLGSFRGQGLSEGTLRTLRYQEIEVTACGSHPHLIYLTSPTVTFSPCFLVLYFYQENNSESLGKTTVPANSEDRGIHPLVYWMFSTALLDHASRDQIHVSPWGESPTNVLWFQTVLRALFRPLVSSCCIDCLPKLCFRLPRPTAKTDEAFYFLILILNYAESSSCHSELRCYEEKIHGWV